MTDAYIVDPLAELLDARLREWKRARDPQEEKLLDCYYDVMRIPRDGDTKGTGQAKSKKAKGLFMGSTRNKVRSARAKINDALFGNGKLPFDTNPVDEKLAPFADVVEDIIKEQLERGKFKDKLSAGVNALATYGTGFVFGPFVRREKLIETYADNSAGFTEIKENVYEYDFPYFELGNTLDVYPDPEARSKEDASGFFWVTMLPAYMVRAWKSDKSYKNIDQALMCVESNTQAEGSEQARQMRGASNEFWHDKGRIKVARYFGKIPKRMHSTAEADQASEEQIDAVVIMAGGVVVKVDKSPWQRNPTMPCVYEAADHEIWGVGVAENNAPNQKNINAAFRLMNEGKGIALNPPTSVDRSRFMPSENFKFGPGKVYDMKPGLSPQERETALMVHEVRDVSDGWMNLIQMSEQFSDDDTGITKYTQGDDSSHLNKTATGISMIMSASSLPIKEVIQHIDSMWIEPMIEALIEWNLKYLDVETVQKIHGDEAAQLWAQVKQFGKTSFLEWKATGTASFMQKEVLANKLQAFSQFALSSPITAEKVDVRELLEQTWDVLEIGKESPIVKDEDGKSDPKMQAMQQQLRQLEEALQNAAAEVEKLESEKGSKADELEVKRIEANTKAYEAITKRLQVLGPLLNPVEVKALAEETKREAMSQIDPGMPPSESMAVPEQAPEMPPDPNVMQPEQPAQAGFFTPEDGGLPPEMPQ